MFTEQMPILQVIDFDSRIVIKQLRLQTDDNQPMNQCVNYREHQIRKKYLDISTSTAHWGDWEIVRELNAEEAEEEDAANNPAEDIDFSSINRSLSEGGS